jgi:hypothetical protein
LLMLLLLLFTRCYVGELLRNTGEFMKAKFAEVCETIIKYKESSNKLVKKTVIGNMIDVEPILRFFVFCMIVCVCLIRVLSIII